MEGRHVGIIVLVLVILVGGWYAMNSAPAQTPTTGEEPVSTTPVVKTEGVTVVYTDQGYFPPSSTISRGTEVTFLNQSTKDMWPASAAHPTHTAYSGTALAEHCPDTTGTAFDACDKIAPGGMYKFTFGKVGTWKYHDHLDPTKYGSITVTAK